MKNQNGYVLSRSVSFGREQPGFSFRQFWQRLKHWHDLANQRRMLATLDDMALKDIGLSRADALQESERPFWDESEPSESTKR